MENIKKIKEKLTTAIFEVFEKMFYVFSEPLRSSGDTYDMRASITFDGPVRGEMQIFLNRPIAETMVKNMLGFDEEEINDLIIADCIKESVNMICGNFVRKLDPERVFNLSIPSFDIISGQSLPRLEKKEEVIHLMFAADVGNVEITMTTFGTE